MAGVEVSPGERGPGRLNLDLRMFYEPFYDFSRFASARAVRFIVEDTLFRAKEDGGRFHLFGVFGCGLISGQFGIIFTKNNPTRPPWVVNRSPSRLG